MLTPLTQSVEVDRRRVWSDLIRAVLRVTPISYVAATFAATIGLFLVASRGAHDPAQLLTVVTLLLPMGSGLVFTDRSATTTASVVVSLRVRTSVRVCIIVLLLAIAWGVTIVMARTVIEEPIDVWRYTLHLITLTGLATALSQRAARRDPGSLVGGQGAAAVFGCFAMTKALAFRFAWIPDIGMPQSPGTWWVVLGVSLVALWHETRDYVMP